MGNEEVEHHQEEFKYVSPDGNIWGKERQIAQPKPKSFSWASFFGFPVDRDPDEPLSPLTYIPDPTKPEEIVEIPAGTSYFEIHFLPPQSNTRKGNANMMEGWIKLEEHRESEEYLRMAPAIIRNGAIQLLDLIEEIKKKKPSFDFIIGTTNKQMSDFAVKVLGFHNGRDPSAEFVAEDNRIVVAKTAELMERKENLERYARR